MSQKYLNLRQRKWPYLLKDYYLVIDYHLGTANVVADAFSRKSLFSLRALNTPLTLIDDCSTLVELKAKLMFLQQICKAQKCDDVLIAKWKQIETTPNLYFHVSSDDSLYFKGRIYVLRNSDLVQNILQEAYSSSLSIHPGSNKMYDNLKQMHWCPVRTIFLLERLFKLYVAEIVRLHDMPVSIISDSDLRFASQF
ncbi:uncharacterized protein LOC128033862 [Gossypium raimondii]|uniref:uncharacterized protein LOC128033862 n=1 Tax=Gossypium raimondii TaxID=29730 RepID=UPI00227BA1B2|nr:uncharacterized protein LOC128033862 [Gossypium raimondii]